MQSVIKEFQKNGVVFIRNALNNEMLHLLGQGVNHNLKNMTARAKIASKDSDTGCFIEDFCIWQTNPYYKEFIFHSQLKLIAAAVMQSKTVRLYHDHLLVKQAKTQQDTPWHQDQPYYNIDGNQNCSFWIPLDKIPLQSSLKFVQGSHLGPWYLPRTFKDNKANWFPEGSLLDLPEIEQDQQKFPTLCWAMQPGDVLCFHMATLHASAGSENLRRAYSIRFLGDDIRHAPRPWPTSPDFPGLRDELPKGSAMNHPLFPLCHSMYT